MEIKKVPAGLLLTLCVTIAGYAVTFGVCQQKIEQNTKDIDRIERTHTADVNRLTAQQESMNTLLQSINTQLVELNTKMSLLLNGKITQE